MSLATPTKLALSSPLPETRPSIDALEGLEHAVEVEVRWGEHSLLCSETIGIDEAFSVGEGRGEPTNFLIGKAALGVMELPIVVQHEGKPHVWIEGRTCEVTTEPTEVRYQGFVFRVRRVQAARPMAKTADFERAPLLYVAGASLLLLLLLLIFSAFVPPHSGLNVNALDQQTMFAEYLLEAQEQAQEAMPDWMVGAMADAGSMEGKAHAGDEGALGDPEAAKVKKRYAVRGPKNNPNPGVPREHAVEQTKTAGILGALATLALPTDGPTSPFAKAHAQGADDVAAVGTMLGEVGASFGFNGLGLHGTGRLGGGDGEGTIGMGNHATLGGKGIGCGEPGDCSGQYGLNATAAWTRRAGKGPVLRPGSVSVVGSLSKEAIRRTVRRHINEVRHCYERELQARPDLAGRVSIKFVIAPTGAVQSSLVANSSVGDANVEQCISTAVRRWGFPEPDNGGVVAVTYPFMLSVN